LVVTWIFPPFEGYTVNVHYFVRLNLCLHSLWAPLSIERLSDDPWLETKYRQNPDAVLSKFIVITNVVSGRKDIVALFWENKLGVDVDVFNHLYA
jgi:hypothetical protein